MSPALDVARSLLRDGMRARRDAIDPARKLEASDAIQRNLEELPAFGEANSIGFHYAVGSEVMIGDLIRRAVEEQGRRAFLPFVVAGRLELTEWRPSDPVVDEPAVGMRPRFSRPSPLDDLDAIVLTGLGFDRTGRRLGRGTGLHDELLARLPERVTRIGIQFSELVIPRLDDGADTRRMDYLVTEAGILDCRSGTASGR
jgi:5-formyltetrahydrofolate cyclo-ligase